MNNRRKLIVSLGAGALAAPFSSFAQQPTNSMRRIGFLGPSSAAGIAKRLEAFRAGLRELGYVEGRNILIDYRWAEGDYSRLSGLAAELVQLNVEMIVTHGGDGARAAKQATATIPIVMAVVGDAVANGIVTNLARPGGNITGSTFFQPQILAKRVELIKEAAPHITQVAFLLNRDNAGNTGPTLSAVENAAKLLKIGLQRFPVRTPDEFEGAFLAMTKKRISAVITSEDSMTIANIKKITDLAAKQHIFSIGAIESAEAGGLIGYGVNSPDIYRRAAYFVDKLLKGAKPADLPVEQPTRFEMVVNLKTAKTLGIKIPNSILVRADKIIE
jgi:putative ABC transport system substrate-binding protein